MTSRLVERAARHPVRCSSPSTQRVVGCTTTTAAWRGPRAAGPVRRAPHRRPRATSLARANARRLLGVVDLDDHRQPGEVGRRLLLGLAPHHDPLVVAHGRPTLPAARFAHGRARARTLLAMERFGFVGLPNAGKSSLYNALAGGGALAAPYAFATTDPNVGMARVPDPRLDALAEMSQSKNVVPATVQFVDIGGLVAGASKGEGLGNKFLSHIREVDAIVFVLRAFADDDVPGPSDPLEHLGVVELELTYADLETVENQIEKRRKAAKGDKSLVDEVAALDKAKAVLEAGTPIYRSDLKDDDRALLKGYFLLTNRPVMALVNIAEDQLDDMEAVVAPGRAPSWTGGPR